MVVYLFKTNIFSIFFLVCFNYSTYWVQERTLGNVRQLSLAGALTALGSRLRSATCQKPQSWDRSLISWKWYALDLGATDSHFMFIEFFFFCTIQVFLTPARSL